MTFTEEFVPVQDVREQANYPTAFGVTFTPTVLGWLAIVAGLMGGLYLLLNQVLPTIQANRDLAEQVEASKAQLETQKKSLENRGEFEARKQSALAEFDQTMDLFADESSLDTLLLDISQQIPNPKEILRSFSPEGEVEVVTDGSLGEGVNGMLKRQAYTVEIEGTYKNTQQFLDRLERLQPLMLVTSVETESAELVQEVNVGPFGQISINRKDPLLNSTINLQALIERSREEIEADRTAAAAAPADGTAPAPAPAP